LDQSIKQRIVGITVILVAAAAILPVLFDGQGSYELPLEGRIPEPAPFPVPPRIVPERPVVVADTAEIRINPDNSASAGVETLPDIVSDPGLDASAAVAGVEEMVAEAPPAVAAPGLDSVGLPVGWSVRLASFSNIANARNLVERLQARGYRAYTRDIRSAQGPLTAVFVGPGVAREAVQQLQRQLLEEFQLSGIVVPYEIEQL
jgi:DedD protein